MHKKLEADLISLAHSVLQMKNKDEVIALRDKAHSIYEKLAVLAFVDEYISSTPNVSITKEDILEKLDRVADRNNLDKNSSFSEKSKDVESEVDEVKETKTIFEPKFDSVKIDIQSLKKNQISSKEEFRDTISADKTASLFDEDAGGETKKTLNDKLFNKAITVGLNDRIAFVNNLFDSNQGEFNRILSQLNTFKTEKEARNFINNTVKPDYDWSGKEDYEERLLSLIERKFS